MAQARKTEKSQPEKSAWPKNSSGQRLTSKVPVVLPTDTLSQVNAYISGQIKDLETINYIYVVDKSKKLIGVFPLKDLYRLPATTAVQKIYKRPPLVSVLPTTDQEEAAYKALQHNLKAVPVVDKNNTFLGVIPSDAILTILHRELREDILQLAGIHRGHLVIDNVLEIPAGQAIKHRLPWLLLGLLGGLFAAGIIGNFQETIERNLILAAFIPLVVYLADAVENQLEAFVIRDFALTRQVDFIRYFSRQFPIVLLMALILGLSLTVLSFFLYTRLDLAIVLGVAVIAAVSSALFTGLVIPFFFRKIKFDPANASGPIATIIQDILSVSVYFLIASWLL